ncbi:polysaccharide deacetylase family protein [Streptacidiphilus monticola]|uniref:Polysaccharide deacetylase family protein n=1 Tax=Streptacidiphilus monticola TaxID=2161674 RepID=A0ABW1G8F4_9ACTN
MDVKPARAAGAGLLLAAAIQIVPAGSWLPGPRRRWLPGLAGLGDPGHVALTLDDGPDPASTPLFLDALDRLGVRATFFLLGARARQFPSLTREISSRGHETAVHGWAHSWPWLTPWRDRHELARATEAVQDATGTAPEWYRPPFGVLTATRWHAARHAGLRPVLWSAWARDWPPDATAESVTAIALGQLHGGATLLLHDSDHAATPDCWRATLAALPTLVTACRASGWQVGPLSEHGLTTADVAARAPIHA